MSDTVGFDCDLRLADIRSEWGWVKTGVQEIIELNPNLTFIAEDVYAACKAGQATLWVTGNNAFAVTCQLNDEFTGNKTFLIWLTWSVTRTPVTLRYLKKFEEIAKSCGNSHIEARTKSERLGKALKRAGWSLDHIVFNRSL